MHIKVEKVFYCDFEGCKSKFLNMSRLRTHKNMIHLGTNNIFCEVCGKKFHSKGTFENHQRSAHTLERPFVCEVTPDCGKAFYSKSTLSCHIRIVHGEKMSCPTCGVVIKKESFRVHKRIHEVISKFFNLLPDLRFFLLFQMKYQCDFENCNKRFMTEYIMKCHKKTHLGQRDFECSFCGASYYANVGLRKHIR